MTYLVCYPQAAFVKEKKRLHQTGSFTPNYLLSFFPVNDTVQFNYKDIHTQLR